MPVPIWNLVMGVLQLRCPLCLKGRVFHGLFEARRRCEHCGYFFARESGYFLGSSVFGYAATLAVALVAWFFLSFVVGLGQSWYVLAVLLAIVTVFPIGCFRHFRMLWMAFDLYLNPPVQEDFEARGR